MKRYGYLYPQITDFNNLIIAAQKAQKGKRYNPDVLEFNHRLGENLLQLQEELASKTYQAGEYRTFYIQESKKRMISAAPYRDRVVHHALCNIIVPVFEKGFINDSYANRVGFGTHRALKRFTKFARSSEYVLQCDIRKYFPSIDHEILKKQICRKIKCSGTLWLIDAIIDNSNVQEFQLEYFDEDSLLTPISRRKGLPIGNLTSQFFANVYLDPLDHFIKHQLKIKKYLRYVDDFALFGNDPRILRNARQEIELFLESLRLRIHPIKSNIHRTKYGSTFLGFRIFPDYIRVANNNLQRAKTRLKQLHWQYRRGKISKDHIEHSLQSWCSHLEHGDTWQLQQQIFSSLTWLRS